MLKRKSSGGSAGGQKKRQGVAIREGLGFTQVELQPDSQGCLVWGSGSIEVTAGAVEVCGFSAAAGAAPFPFSTDPRAGGALLLQPAAAAARAPRLPAAAAATIVVHSAAASPTAPAAASAASQPGGECSYGVCAAGDGAAPPHYAAAPEWRGGAAAVAEESRGRRERGDAPVIAAVCGPKGSGKSTFSRLLANALVAAHGAAVFLDTDCGQPEMTPPGLVSAHVLTAPLLGPPHLHQQRPALAFFQGDVSPESDPGRYIQSLQQLISWYWSSAAAAAGAPPGAPPPPLVINTHGWVAGVGLELLAELLRAAAPTHVIQLQTPNARKNLPEGCFWLEGGGGDPQQQQQQQQQPGGAPQGAPAAAIVPLPALRAPPSAGAPGRDGAGGGGEGAAPAASGDVAASVASRQSAGGDAARGGAGRAPSAVEARSLHWLSWARRVCAMHGGGGGGGYGKQGAGGGIHAADAACASAPDADRFADAAAALAAAPPLAAPLCTLRVRSLHDAAPPSQAARVANGALVGLIAGDAPFDRPFDQGFDQAFDQQQQQQQPWPCVGLGLVRAADAARGILYLLTDAPPDALAAVRELHCGRLELPQPLLQPPGAPAAPYDALFCLSAAATGSGAARSRNNLLRASLAPAGARQR